MEQIIYGNIRVQLLSAELVRVEYGKDGNFCDGNTFLIPERQQFSTYRADFSQEGNVVCFGEYELYLPEDPKSLAGLKLDKSGKRVYNYKRMKNTGELPAVGSTPQAFALFDCPRITVPEGGYTYRGGIKNSGYVLEEKAQDLYLLLCEGDAKKLRRLYVGLTGRCELVRLATLGSWNSKYIVYNEESAKQVILDYEAHNVPLDNMVIDTDWRAASDRGIGYDIDTKLFPNMKRFLSFAHDHGVEIMFNDHPEPVGAAKSVLAPSEVRYREKKLQSLMALGLDTWWYDRNWSTKLKSPVKDVHPETFGLYLFEEVTKHFYQKQAGSDTVYRRPVIMGNVDNVENGVYHGIDSSASHRYSIQWTGDVASDYAALTQEVENLVRCTDNCIAYVNADCGGHTGNPDKEQFIRWMQFGTLSPVFRPHCTINLPRTREPWAYDEETLSIVREYNNLRYRLLPVIYKNAYNCYETGEPVFHGLGLQYPSDKAAVKCKDEYMLGNDLLMAPVTGVCPVPLEARNYADPVKSVFYSGRECAGEPIADVVWKKLDMDLNGTSPAKGVPATEFSAVFETTVRAFEERDLFIKIDDGATVYVDGKKVLEDKTVHVAAFYPLCRMNAGEPYQIRIEYFQADGAACCGLYSAEVNREGTRRVYLPEGKWLDLFDGKQYNGNKVAARKYQLRETPLFVRLGALLPLAYEAKNTKEQKWDKLVYDFYPCKESSDSGYLYEDDTETTAYKSGQFRKSAYRAYFSAEDNAFIVRFSAAEGAFEGEKCFESRSVTLKYHLLAGARGVSRITVNGLETKAEKCKKDAEAFPLNTCGGAADSDTLLVTFEALTGREYEVRFYLS